ncbi:MAG: glycosyltransferase [bacterium]
MNITYIVPRHNDEIFNRCLLKHFTRFSSRTIQISNDPSLKSITHKYYMGIDVSKQKNILDNDIVVFAHEDVTIVDNFFEDKLKYIFENNDMVGVVGVVGTELILENDWWLEDKAKPKGKILQGLDNPTLIKFGEVGFYDNVVCVDNCIFAVRGSLFNQINFDMSSFEYDNHTYSMDICLQALIQHYKICVADILIQHESTEHFKTSLEWENDKSNFNSKYSNIKFPISINNIKLKSPEIIEVKL